MSPYKDSMLLRLDDAFRDVAAGAVHVPSPSQLRALAHPDQNRTVSVHLTSNLPAESFFTVVYKLTDANIAKYLSNRDWVTYVYADSMAELRRQHTENETLRAIAAAYKPTHGGYTSAGARA